MMTRRQMEMYKFLERYIDAHGYAPTYAAIQDGLGMASKSGVPRLLDALVERGYINRIPNRAQAIELTGKCIPLPTNAPTVRAPVPNGIVWIPLYTIPKRAAS